MVEALRLLEEGRHEQVQAAVVIVVPPIRAHSALADPVPAEGGPPLQPDVPEPAPSVLIQVARHLVVRQVQVRPAVVIEAAEADAPRLPVSVAEPAPRRRLLAAPTLPVIE